MRQAIITKYIGPTNHKGSRIKASCAAKSITINWNHELDVESNHAYAALRLLQELGWDEHNTILGGSVENGYVFVQIEKSLVGICESCDGLGYVEVTTETGEEYQQCQNCNYINYK